MIRIVKVTVLAVLLACTAVACSSGLGGTDKEVYVEAHGRAWDDGCRYIFKDYPTMYNGDNSYTAEDCMALRPPMTAGSIPYLEERELQSWVDLNGATTSREALLKPKVRPPRSMPFSIKYPRSATALNALIFLTSSRVI